MFDAVGPARPLVDGLATPGLFWLDLRPAGLLLMLSPMPSCQRSDDTPRPCLRCSRAYRLTAPRADHHGKAHQSHHMQQILSPRLALFRRCFLHEPRVTGGARRLRCPRRLLCLCAQRRGSSLPKLQHVVLRLPYPSSWMPHCLFGNRAAYGELSLETTRW
jgi:hypothetical protein